MLTKDGLNTSGLFNNDGVLVQTLQVENHPNGIMGIIGAPFVKMPKTEHEQENHNRNIDEDESSEQE